jgi:dCMP deaminase
MNKLTKWDKRFFQEALIKSSFSKDPSTQVGAVAVNDDHVIISSGWNGFPRGIADDQRLNNRDTKYPLIVHAEMNLIYNAARIGLSLKNSKIYVYGMLICNSCALGIIQSGIKHVFIIIPEESEKNIFRWSNSWNLSKQIFDETNIRYSLYKMSELNQ